MERLDSTPGDQQFFAGQKTHGRLTVGEPEEPGRWGLVFGDSGQEQVLNFKLDEIREARLVPVIDFKGRQLKQRAAADQDKKPDGDLTP
jgi:ribosome maturation factor RimP